MLRSVEVTHQCFIYNLSILFLFIYIDLHIPYECQWSLHRVIFFGSCSLPAQYQSCFAFASQFPVWQISCISHEICTLGPASCMSPFGPQLTHFCCRLFYSMNLCTRLQLIDKALVLMIRYRIMCQIRGERLRDHKVVGHQRYFAPLGVTGDTCPSCRAAWRLLPHNMTWWISLIPYLIISHYSLIHRHWVLPAVMHLLTYCSSASLLLPYSSLLNPTRLANLKQFLQTSGLAPCRNDT